jgi:hypothetical protein
VKLRAADQFQNSNQGELRAQILLYSISRNGARRDA